MNNKNIYDNCISLGWFCGTASAMSKHGLRGASGPFDWCTSKLEAVLMMMENHFGDFMQRENLQMVENSNHIQDIKYGFVFPHEVSDDFEEEYLEILKKYKRRIERFMEAIKKPTLFMRAVRGKEEVDYINKNAEHIHRVIKRENVRNEIVFLVTAKMPDIIDDFEWFRLEIENYSNDTYSMRTMFNASGQLVEYCANNILSSETINNNRIYEEKNLSLKIKSALVAYNCKKMDNWMIRALVSFFPDIYNRGIYLWGAGNYGFLLLNYVLKQGVKVNAIIDNKKEKWGNVNGVSVCSVEEVDENEEIYIVVAVSSEAAVENIIEQIESVKDDAKVITFADIYNCLQKQGYVFEK